MSQVATESNHALVNNKSSHMSLVCANTGRRFCQCRIKPLHNKALQQQLTGLRVKVTTSIYATTHNSWKNPSG